MNLRLDGYNALVCGSSQGIGKAVAIELALLGANITLLARNASRLQLVLSQLPRTETQQHDFLVADFSQPQTVAKSVQAYLQITQKSFHILINNTGGPASGAIVEASPEAFLNAYQAHLVCNQLLAQTVLEGMKKANFGRIINIISTSVKEPIEGLGVSNTTRAAVAAWAKTWSAEVGRFGITVNNVLPGFTATQRLETIVDIKIKQSGQNEQEVINTMLSYVPARRFATPEEVAAPVAFLASPAAAYINGINLAVDGGRTKSM